MMKKLSIIRFTFILLLGFVPSASKTSLEEVKIEHLQAAFVFKFTNYIEWPDKIGAPFLIGIYKNKELFIAMKNTLEGKKINERQVVVNSIDQLEGNTQYDILHITEIDAGVAKSLNTINTSGLLLITQSNKGLHDSAVINFYRDEEDRLKFEINGKQAITYELKINSRLLNLSRSQK